MISGSSASSLSSCAGIDETKRVGLVRTSGLCVCVCVYACVNVCGSAYMQVCACVDSIVTIHFSIII